MGHPTSLDERHPLAIKRAKAGMTQGDLAAAAGVHLDTIKRLEAGRQTPSLRTAFAIAAVFRIRDPRKLFPTLA